jgi:NTP pyrophosphatase (non-canonical NTP hydrolase)
MDVNLRRKVDHLIARAVNKYGNFASTHEALGVIWEEFCELSDAVRANDPGEIMDEALDIAAVCMRLADEIYNEQGIWKRSTK